MIHSGLLLPEYSRDTPLTILNFPLSFHKWSDRISLFVESSLPGFDQPKERHAVHLRWTLWNKGQHVSWHWLTNLPHQKIVVLQSEHQVKSPHGGEESNIYELGLAQQPVVGQPHLEGEPIQLYHMGREEGPSQCFWLKQIWLTRSEAYLKWVFQADLCKASP